VGIFGDVIEPRATIVIQSYRYKSKTRHCQKYKDIIEQVQWRELQSDEAIA